MCGCLLQNPHPDRPSTRDAGKKGFAIQCRGSPCEWYDLPPVLLLFSKRKLAERLPTVFKHEDNKLTQKRGATLPWLAYNWLGDKPGVDEEMPWWHCLTCYNYYHHKNDETGFRSDCRLPMRNWFGGYSTRWYIDLGYPHLYPKLRDELYPKHPMLPHPDEVLQWRKETAALRTNWTKYHDDERIAAESGNWRQRDALQARLHELHRRKLELKAKERKRAPPAHASKWGTPIPKEYFQAAVKLPKGQRSRVDKADDLVPHEQPDLVQDVINEDLLAAVQSVDARACVSLTRPETQLTQTRQLTKTRKVMPTMLHQAGDLPLQSLTMEQDKARGFFTNMAVTEECRNDYFKLRKEEHRAMPNVLTWLHERNPWFAAYRSSLNAVRQSWEELTDRLHNIGWTAGIESAVTRKGQAWWF